jgi:hypothetical protein
MLAITHLMVTLVLIQVLVLDRNDAFVALLFGVFIDLDHLFGLKDYTQAHGFRALFDFDHLMHPGGHWKSMLHSPVAVAVVGPLSVASRLAVPLVFWGVHIAMDFAQERFLGTFSEAEAMLLLFSTFVLVALRYTKFVERRAEANVFEYFKDEFSGLRHLALGVE